jgi:hypothetical protein
VQVETVDFALKRRIGLRGIVRAFEIEDQRHQCFGDEAAAEYAEHALFVGSGAE